jgi:hypothetical protein
MLGSAFTNAWLRFIKAAILLRRPVLRLRCWSFAWPAATTFSWHTNAAYTHSWRYKPGALLGLMAQIVAVLLGQDGAQGWMELHYDPSVVGCPLGR